MVPGSLRKVCGEVEWSGVEGWVRGGEVVGGKTRFRVQLGHKLNNTYSSNDLDTILSQGLFMVLHTTL